MRYDKPIIFEKVTPGAYLADGNYSEESVEETVAYADITDASEKTLLLVYGSLKEGSLVVRINQHHNSPFNFIRINGKRYKVDSSRKLRHIHTFVVSEVQ